MLAPPIYNMATIQKQEKRTGLDEACLQIAQLVAKNDEDHMFTINQLKDKTGLTVLKFIN